MTDATKFVRRNRVDERTSLGIALVGGLLAAVAGARPTGSSAVDIGLTFLFAGAVVWASASAPWWAVAAACGVGGAVAMDPLLAAVGFVGFAAGLWLGLRRRDLAEMRALLGAIAVNVLIRSELGEFLGLSAIIGISVCMALFVLGVKRRPKAIRRPAWIVSGTVGAVAVIALLGAATSALGSRTDLTAGNDRARAGIAALNSGDYAGAAALFGDAGNAFGRADDRLGGVLAAPAYLIPGVSQNLSAGADLAAAASGAMATASSALDQIDPASLRLVDGAIDIEAISAIEEPLQQVQEEMDALRSVAGGLDSPWLIGRLQDELVELEAELDENEPRLDNALSAVRLAPQMLGADGPRRYLLLFTTPVETRGIAGLAGNYAEIAVDQGAISVTEFGRRSELDAAAAANQARCTGCSQELIERYGPFGMASGPDGVAATRVWTEITRPAHFPYVGEAAQSFYPQSGGRPIDGVISIDPYVIQALMQYTGPITIDDSVTVTPDRAADFILREQYLLAGDDGNDERIDGLETLGETAITRLLTGAMPEPSRLASDMGPLVEEHRLLFWTDDPDEQAFLDQIGMLGAMPPLVDDTGFSVFVANDGGSKIDVFLDRTVEAEIVTAPDGNRSLVADVTLTNNAPSSGLPEYVIGSAIDLPPGTSRLVVTFYGPDALRVITTDATADGEVDLTRLAETQWTAFVTSVEIPAGESVSYHLEFNLPQVEAPDDAALGEWVQPLAIRTQ